MQPWAQGDLLRRRARHRPTADPGGWSWQHTWPKTQQWNLAKIRMTSQLPSLRAQCRCHDALSTNLFERIHPEAQAPELQTQLVFVHAAQPKHECTIPYKQWSTMSQQRFACKCSTHMRAKTLFQNRKHVAKQVRLCTCPRRDLYGRGFGSPELCARTACDTPWASQSLSATIRSNTRVSSA